MSTRTALRHLSEQLPLEEVALIRSGKTPARGTEAFWNGRVPWYSAKDLKTFRLIDSEEHISDQALQSGAPLGDVGDLLVLVRGMTLLKDVPVGLLQGPGSYNQDLKLIRPNGKVSAEYLGYMLAASKPLLMAMVNFAGHGTGRLEMDQLRALPIWVPKPKVQKFVEDQLKVLDRTLLEQQRLIKAKRELTRGLSQKLLSGQVRFPEFRDQKWTEVHLGEVFNERCEANRPDLPLLSVTNDRGLIPRGDLEKRDTSNADKSKYKRVAVGDIAYNTMRMWQGVSALSSLEGIVSPAYTVAIPTKRIHGGFAKHLFKSPSVVHLFYRFSQGLVDDTLNLKYERFAKVRIRMPNSTKEQKRIAEILDLCHSEISLLLEQRRQFELYRRALLSRLLSGDIPVVA